MFRAGFTIGTAAEKIVFLTFGRAATASDTAVWMPEYEDTRHGQDLRPGHGGCDRAGSDTDSLGRILLPTPRSRTRNRDPRPGRARRPRTPFESTQSTTWAPLPGRGRPSRRPKCCRLCRQLLCAVVCCVAGGRFANRRRPRFRSVFDEVGSIVPPWELMEERVSARGHRRQAMTKAGRGPPRSCGETTGLTSCLSWRRWPREWRSCRLKFRRSAACRRGCGCHRRDRDA